MDPIESKRLTLDYEQTLAYFRTLHDVRFKLLGFLPAITGLAVAVGSDQSNSAQQLALGCIGLVVTLGIISYDQRNTQIYDRLVRRARFLEREIGFLPLPGDQVNIKFGGPFHSRPKLIKVCGVRLIWHIQGLALVYSASVTGWCYLIVDANCREGWLTALLTGAALVVSYTVYRIVAWIHHKETWQIKIEIESKS